MGIDLKETHGRRLIVEFKCRRCQATAVRDFNECLKEAEDCCCALYDLKPPKDWKDGGFYYPMFCPDCAKAYDSFMRGDCNG